MGYDKPDLGFVVHVGAPPSPVSYYQQVGRAGRAIDHAHAVLLPSDADAGVWDYFATATIPVPGPGRARCSAVLVRTSRESVRGASRPSPGVRRGRVELMLKQLAVDGVDRAGRGRLARDRARRGTTTPSTTTASSPSAAARPTSCAPTPAASAA